MPLFVVLALSGAVLGVSAFLFKRAAGSIGLDKPNMISYIFYYNFILQTFIASIVVVMKLDDHYVISGVSDNARYWGWLSVQYVMLAFPLGMLLSKRVFLGRQSVADLLGRYVTKDINMEYMGGKGLKYSIWFATVLSMLACCYVFFVLGYHPFIKVLTAGAGELAGLRITASRDFSGSVHIRNFFALSMMPILSYSWFLYYAKTKYWLDGAMFVCTLFFSVSALYYNFAKSPILWYILSYLFVVYYAFGYLSKKYLVFSVGAVSLLMVVFYSFVGVDVGSFMSFNSGPVGRIVLGQSSGLYLMFDIFPQIHPSIGFDSLSQLLSNLFGLDYRDRAARYAMEYFNPRGVEIGEAGVMNSIFIAEAWSNFGFWGVILSPIWVGFVIHTMYVFFLKQDKNPLFLALFVAFSVGGSVTGGFNDYIYNPGLIMMLVYTFLILLLGLLIKLASKG